MLDEQQLGALLMAARDGGSVFRWEGLRRYTVDSDGGDYERYVAGERGPTMTRKKGWLSLLRTESARGVHWHRVRLIQPPLSNYERYASEWGYAYNTGAGDDCRVLDLSAAIRPAGMPDHDFWLVDGTTVARMHYDDEGRYLGADLAPDAAPYQAARDALWEAGEEFFTWWDGHPEHHRDAHRVVA